MMFRTHLAIGLLAGLLLISYLSPTSKWLFLAGFTISAVLPDIDHPKSKVGKKVKPVSSVLNLLFGHRGLLHTIYPALALFFLLTAFNQPILAVAAVLGYITHLALDALTPDGVRFFWPLWHAQFKWRLRTGGIADIIIFFAGIAGIIIKAKEIL